MIAAAGMLWSTLVRPIYADETVGRLGWYGGFAATELASEEWALSCGVEETSPLLRDRGARMTLKMGQVAGMMWLDGYLAKRDKRLMWAVRIIYGLANAGIAYRNMRQVR
jgi:hypothetical protein